MPIVEPAFRSPLFLRGGHLQTLAAVFLPTRREVVTPEHERLELADGDFLDLFWRRRSASRLAILCHGLEGNAGQNYVRRLAAELAAAGWDTVAWNYRGCSPQQPNRLSGFYHSGATDDLRRVVQHVQETYAKVALVGFSLGGNLVLKYLGEQPPSAKIVAAAAVSAPVQLAASTLELDTRWSNRLYVRRFLRTLVRKVEAKAARFPGRFDLDGIRRMRTFWEFDDRYTARVHGFQDAADYWRQSSSRQFLAAIRVPTLLLSARDDPFLPRECFPWREAEENPCLYLEAPQHGGHVGFVDASTLRGGPTWAERQIAEFFRGVLP